MIFPAIGFSEIITLLERSKVENTEYLPSGWRPFTGLSLWGVSFFAEPEL